MGAARDGWGCTAIAAVEDTCAIGDLVIELLYCALITTVVEVEIPFVLVGKGVGSSGVTNVVFVLPVSA